MRKATVLLILDNQDESSPVSFTFNGISSTGFFHQNIGKEWIGLLLDNKVVGVPVFIGEKEHLAHGKAVLRADACTLRTEDTLAYPDTDALYVRNELYCMSRADFCTQPAPDACVPLVGDLTAEIWRGRNRRYQLCPPGPHIP